MRFAAANAFLAACFFPSLVVAGPAYEIKLDPGKDNAKRVGLV